MKSEAASEEFATHRFVPVRRIQFVTICQSVDIYNCKAVGPYTLARSITSSLKYVECHKSIYGIAYMKPAG